MLITHNNQTEIVTSLQDCYFLGERDGNRELVEATEHFINNGEEDTLQERFDDLESEFECYEMSLESREACLIEVKEVVERLLNRIDGKRLNRNEIVGYLESIKSTIENEF